MDLAVIILNWNQPHLTVKAIESVKIPSNFQGQIIVADNGSTDDSLEVFKKVPGIDVIPLDRNYGFARGYNMAVAYTQKKYQPDYLLLLNNDAQLHQNALEILYSQREQAEVLSPKIYYGDKETLWACGGRVRIRKGWAKNIGQGESDHGQCDHPEEIDFASGCALWLDSRVLVGEALFAPEFVSYFEDVDFCYRIKKAGYKVRFIPEAVVYHEVGRTGGDEFGLQQSRIRWRNRLLMVLRNGKMAEKLYFALLILPSLIVRDSFRYLRRKKIAELKEAFKGLLCLPSELKAGK